MTREEKGKAIDALKISAPVKAVTQEEFNDYIQILNKVMDWLEQEPCEAVSREAVNDLVDELARAISDERCCISRGRNTVTIMQDILDLPSVTPTRAKGKWVWDSFFEEYACSCCYSGSDTETHFCPNCGARMMEGVSE